MKDLKTSKEEEIAKEEARKVWDNWIGDLKEKEQPESCNIHDETCENCGS